MRKILYAVIILLAITAGCKKEESNPVSEEPQKSLVVKTISGQLNNWSYYRYYCAEFDVFGKAVIDEFGKFDINSISEPTQQQLTGINTLFDTLKEKPVISDKSVGCYVVTSLSMAKAKTPERVIGLIQNSGGKWGKDYFTTSYIYLDKPVTINGYALHTYYNGYRNSYRKEHYNNLTFEKGWNKFVSQVVSMDEASGTVNIEILREEPVEGTWAYSEPLKTVVVTGSTSYAGLKYPLCIDNGFKRSAALYTADEINCSGDITKISWKALTRTADLRPVKIYLKEVSSDKLEAESSENILSDATKVYDNSSALLTEYWNWNDFNLIETFYYSAKQNLLVIVETNYGGKGITDDCYFEYSVLNVNRFLTWSWNGTTVQQYGNASSSRPNIKFTIDNY